MKKKYSPWRKRLAVAVVEMLQQHISVIGWVDDYLLEYLIGNRCKPYCERISRGKEEVKVQGIGIRWAKQRVAGLERVVGNLQAHGRHFPERRAADVAVITQRH